MNFISLRIIRSKGDNIFDSLELQKGKMCAIFQLGLVSFSGQWFGKYSPLLMLYETKRVPSMLEALGNLSCRRNHIGGVVLVTSRPKTCQRKPVATKLSLSQDFFLGNWTITEKKSLLKTPGRRANDWLNNKGKSKGTARNKSMFSLALNPVGATNDWRRIATWTWRPKSTTEPRRRSQVSTTRSIRLRKDSSQLQTTWLAFNEKTVEPN